MTTTTANMPADYEARVQQFGLASKSTLQDVLGNKPPVMILDVRTPTEIADSGQWTAAAKDGNTDNNVQYVTVHGVTPTDASSVVEYMKSNTVDNNTSIIVYCRSGRRANTVVKALESECHIPFSQLYNAGGYDDIVAMGFPTKSS